MMAGIWVALMVVLTVFLKVDGTDLWMVAKLVVRTVEMMAR